MTTDLFDRVWRITAYRQPTGFVGQNPEFFERLDNGYEITGLRIRAQVTKSIGKAPNRCDLTITNLSDRARAELDVGATTVHLEAGYDGVLKSLFLGHLKTSPLSSREGASRDTRLQLLDGGRAYAAARVNRSYAAGTPLRSIMRDVARALGWDLPRQFAASRELDQRLAAGLVLEGEAADELTRLLAPYGYGWSVQSGKLQILRDDQTREEQAWLLDTERGLIGDPKWDWGTKKKKPKLSVRALLFPELVPGGRIELDHRDARGWFRLLEVKHDLDSDGQEWYTEVEGRSL